MADGDGSAVQAANNQGIPSDVGSVLGKISDAAGVVANIYGSYQAGVQLLTWFGILQDPLDAIASAIAAIGTKLDQILNAVQFGDYAQSQQAERIAIVNDAGASATAVTQTQEYLEDPTDPQKQTDFGFARNNSLSAVKNLRPFGMWTMIDSPLVYYSNIWGGTVKPVSTPQGINSPLTLDWRLGLPTYATAVLVRFAVLCASDPSYKEDIRNEIHDYVAQLQTAHDVILSSFRPISCGASEIFASACLAADRNNWLWWETGSGASAIPPPDIDAPPLEEPGGDWAYIGDDQREQYLLDQSEFWNFPPGTDRVPGGRFIRAGYPYGVVESFTGSANVNPYPEGFFRFIESQYLQRPTARQLSNPRPNETEWQQLHLGVDFPPNPLFQNQELFYSAYDDYAGENLIDTAACAVDLYETIGLGAVRRTIKTLCLAVQIALPKPDSNTPLYYSHLSLRYIGDQFPGDKRSLRDICLARNADGSRMSLYGAYHKSFDQWKKY